MLTLTPCIHKVQYYETDQMKIVHHSNYIRWFEEARTAILDELGAGYAQMEERGILSPVLTVEAKFIQMVRYGETVEIQLAVEKFDGIRIHILYQVVRQSDGAVCCTGKSTHCFLNEAGRPISLKRKYPDIYALLAQLPTGFPDRAV